MIETVPSGTVLHERYRIERVLGSGGFGHVYLASDLTTRHQYAVKEYLVTGPSGQEQLKHEATVLRSLHHPSLPAFIDAFIERGRYYVVLNYIEGNDLTDLIRMVRQRNETIPISQIITWLLAICDAVLFLHNQQPIVIHRDIKPDNIRITPSGTAVLVDLGNAKAAADGSRTLFFIRHQGTPGYAPPEQYPGGSGTDARSDIYALGGTLYFALTMQEPPSVSTRNQFVQQGQPTLPSLQSVLTSNPPEESPEAREARQFRLGVSKPAKPAPRHSRHIAQLGSIPPQILEQLNFVIQKAMALKARERYQFVAEFASDLRRVFMGLSPSSPTPRNVNVHSTQPDLSELYDALQQAKDERAQQQAGQQSSQGHIEIPASPAPSTSAAPASNKQFTCPRCGLVLTSQAAFCPRCGTPLSPPASANQQAAPQNAKQDITGQQTLVVRPDQRQEAAGVYRTIRSGDTASGAARAVVTQVDSKGQGAIRSTPTTSPQLRTPAQQSVDTGQHSTPPFQVNRATPASVPGIRLGPKLILMIVLAIVILLLVVIWLINTLHTHAHPIISHAYLALNRNMPRYLYNDALR